MEKLKQKIHYLISKKNTLWTAAFLSTSGTISLIFKLKSGLTEQIMFITGIIVSVFLLNSCINCEIFIKSLIEKINEDE